MFKLKCLLFIFTGMFITGCYSNEVIKNFTPGKTDASLIRKLNLKDGSSVDFNDRLNPNKLLKIDSKEFVYKDSNGELHTISSNEIYQALRGELVAWRSALFVAGIITAIVFLVFPSVTHQPVL